jgi:hypothetical protein
MKLRRHFGTIAFSALVLLLIRLGTPTAGGQPLDAQTQARIDQFDKGPATINVSGYPDKMKDYYRIFSQKCSQCHRLSRPINSDYVLPEQWSRYIKRMMYKPGSNIGRSEAKKIYDFLVYDSSVRKKKALDEKLKTLAPEERKEQEKAIKEVTEKYQ